MKMLLHIVHYILALRTILLELSKKFTNRFALKTHKQSPSRIRADSKNLKKLPLHIGFLIGEEDFSYTDIAKMLIWSMTMGITYISLYDRTGES